MDNPQFNIKEIKEEVNLLLFNNFNFGLNDLKQSNEILNTVEVAVNEILKTSANFD